MTGAVWSDSSEASCPARCIPASSPSRHGPLVDMHEGVLMEFIPPSLLLLICLPSGLASTQHTTAFPSASPRAGVTFPLCTAKGNLSSKGQRPRGILSTCSLPTGDPTASRAAACPAKPTPIQEHCRNCRSPRTEVWYPTHFSISISHCKGAATAVFIFFSPPLRHGGEEVHF